VGIGTGYGTDVAGTHKRDKSPRPQWLAVAALSVGIAATAIAVPPLITAWSNGGGTASPGGTQRPPTHTAQAPSTAPSSPSAVLTPIRIAAASSGNDLFGTAEAVQCSTCMSGSRVRYIAGASGVVVNVHGVPSAGNRTMTVFYESDGPRTFEISVNNGAPVVRNLPGKGDWNTPASTTLTIVLPAGDSTIRFSNPTGNAPDLDEIVIN